MNPKKLILIVVTIAAAVVALVMVNNLINRGEQAPAPASTRAVVAAPAAGKSAAAPAPAKQGTPVAEESDPQSYSGPMLR